MEYVRKVDFAAMEGSPRDPWLKQVLLDGTYGSRNCAVDCIRTLADGGSPAGLHVHDVDQIFYILRGTMGIEIEGRQYECPPGSLIFFPAGIRHRNWNSGSEPTVHLAFNTPLPDPDRPFARSV